MNNIWQLAMGNNKLNLWSHKGDISLLTKKKPSAVEIKGFGEEIFIIFGSESSFSDIQLDLVEKLYKSKNFLIGTPIALDIKDHILSYDECLKLREILVDKFNLTVSYVRSNSEETVKNIEKIGWSVETFITKDEPSDKTIIVRQTIRSGQKLKFAGNLVLIGDLNPGGEITADGDIVVFGKLRGIAHAGANGNTSATITAIELIPLQLRIAEIIGRSPDSDLESKKVPEIAMIKDGSIFIDVVDKSKRGDG
jgi:septum site-determining protein MinC